MEGEGFEEAFKLYINNRQADTLLAACPWFTDKFLELIDFTIIKAILIIIDSTPEEKTIRTLRKLRQLCGKYGTYLEIRQRPPNSAFMHLKLMIPIYRNDREEKLYARVAFTGSVNFTTSGIKYNDELLIITQDSQNLDQLMTKFDALWNSSKKINI